MNKDATSIVEALMIVLLGSLGSIFVGMARLGPLVFNQHSPAFQYFVVGIAGATLFTIYKENGLRKSFIYPLPLAFLCAIPGQSLFYTNILNLFLTFGFLLLAFHYIWTKFSIYTFGKFLLLAFAMLVFELIRVSAFSLMYGFSNFMNVLQVSASISATLALGLGIGIEIAEILNREIDKAQALKHV